MTGFASADRIALTLCLMALLALLSLMPGNSGGARHGIGQLLDRTPVSLQKVMHVALYAALALLLVWALEGIQVITYRYLTAFITAAGFGALMEWCQTKVPGLFGTVSDVGLNAAGVAIGLLVAVILLKS